jgi:hypothetical protein
MLKTELDEKNKQIERFQERQRENNVLIKSAHEQLTKLASGSTSDSKPATAAETVEANAAKEGSRPEPSVTEASVKPEKKTLWQRLNQPIFNRQ